MKFTLSWLKEHLETTAALGKICDTLTNIGLEVENVENLAEALDPFVIAEVVKTEKHPNADKLTLCTVNAGKENLQIICGAPNVRKGLKGVLARPGDLIPAFGERLKLAKIRGVESQGMLCSARELGLGEDAAGIIELPDDAPVGENYVSYAGLNDPVIEIGLTPNRADCAGVRGVARDLAAAGLGKLKPLNIKTVKGKSQSAIKVRLEFSKGQESACPLFVGRMISNIRNGPSPTWLQQRLRAIGLRPISALVDITNYLTFDNARPMHVFDADKIRGNLWVRAAEGGEILEALNGKAYTLEKGMTIIGDEAGVLSLAGIIGGASSGCDEKTTTVFLESAYFDPIRTAKTGRALQIISDARYRFERGVDPEFVVPGAELATRLIIELCGTEKTEVSELSIVGEIPKTTPTIFLDTEKYTQTIGCNISEEEQVKILNDLGFSVKKENRKLEITVPSWRGDIHGAEDLIEEIARIKGFDHIPAVSLPRFNAVTKGSLGKLERLANKAKRALAAEGLMEAVTWSFMSSDIAGKFGEINPALRLDNPISSDLNVMRPSILGNLVMAIKRNADRGFPDVGFFEVGPVYRDVTPEGQDFVAAAVRAGMTPRNWAVPSRAVDLYDSKADALAVLKACGISIDSIQITTDAPEWYHPGRSGSLRLGPRLLGYFGELHPSLLFACEAEGSVTGCEIFLTAIPSSHDRTTAKPLLRLETLQPVKRDFAFIVFMDVTTEKLVKAIKSVDKKLIRDVTVFDVYEGKELGPNRRSVALSVTIQPTERSLTETEIEKISSRIISAVSKATGATLR